VVFIGIVFEDNPENARQFMQELGGDWPNLIDPGAATALAYGVYGIPETFFIDASGIVRHKRIGLSSYELLVTQIERLLTRE
jgi:cytochrome c biogenesis protein CcmG/thiol:disulfide interchange protein DsbE